MFSGQKIELANAEAVRRMDASVPVLVDLAPAHEVVPNFSGKMLLHAGPPTTWDRMCGAQHGAMIGLTLFEGWADSVEAATQQLASGVIRISPNHHHGAVGSMAGGLSPSLPVWVVENQAPGAGNRAFCGHADSRQTFGEYSPEVLDDLRMWRDVWAPALRQGIRGNAPVPLMDIIRRALQMGDGLHSRCLAASCLLANDLTALMVKAGVPREQLLQTIDHTTHHRLMFLPLAMASAKAITDWASHIEHSTVLVAMACNGMEFGIRVSGLGGAWFTAPAPKAFLRSFVPLGPGVQPWAPGFGCGPVAGQGGGSMARTWTEQDAGFDMGDSAITETVGWGANLLASQLGLLPVVGCELDQALALTQEVRSIAISASTRYAVPILSFEGAPLGIDIRKVVHKNILPVIDTGIAHREPGNSIVGSGLVRPPMACFKSALQAYIAKYAE